MSESNDPRQDGHDSRAKTYRDRLLLMNRLVEQVTALEVYVEFALAERQAQEAAGDLAMSAEGIGSRHKHK